jgi:hypothetical protein
VALRRAVGFLALKRAVRSFAYWGPWYRQNGHLPWVDRLTSKAKRHSQQAGRPPHCPHTTPECAISSAHIGQANQMSFARTAQAGTNIRCIGGGVLADGGRLGLAGGLCLAGGLLLLWPATLATRALLCDRMASGASEVA